MLENLNIINEDDYGYARCSTTLQNADYEIKVLLEKGLKKDHIFIEYESGLRDDRPEFTRLLNLLKSGKSTIYCTDITRLSRSTSMLCSIIDIISQRKLRLVIGNMDIDCRKDELDPMVEGMLKMMAVFAELELKMKKYQIKLGIKNAVSNGKTLGRPKTTKDTIPNIFYKYYPMYKSNKISKLALSNICNLSYPTILKYIYIVENN